MVDSYSKGCEVQIMSSTDSKCTINTSRAWFSRYGPQFTSKEFCYFSQGNGIRHIFSPPYHQSSNGQAERFVQIIKRG